MTYYINPILFYVIDVSEGIKTLLYCLAILMLVASFVAIIILDAQLLHPLTDLDEEEKKPFKVIKKVVIASVISLFIGTFIPSKKLVLK